MSEIQKIRKPYFGKQVYENTEAEVKKWIKEVLRKYDVYFFMPVQSGLGAVGLDFHCVVAWRGIPLAFFIEAKEFGKEPTDRQRLFAQQRRLHQKAVTFVVDGMVGVNKVEAWLKKLQETDNKRMDNGNT